MIPVMMVNGIFVIALTFATGDEKLLEYLERHAREDGGYGFFDQPDSHLEPTYAIIGCYHLLGKAPPRRSSLGKYLKRLGNFFGTPRNLFVHRQLQSLHWLGEPVDSLRTVKDAGHFSSSVEWKPRTHRMGATVLQIETRGLWCRKLLGHPLENVRTAWKEYLTPRRRENGSFNNTPASGLFWSLHRENKSFHQPQTMQYGFMHTDLREAWISAHIPAPPLTGSESVN